MSPTAPTPPTTTPVWGPPIPERRAPATPPAGLPHLEDVARVMPIPAAYGADPSSTTIPRRYIQPAPDGPRRPSPRPRIATPADVVAAAGPDAAHRLGIARSVVARMRIETERHGIRALTAAQTGQEHWVSLADRDAMQRANGEIEGHRLTLAVLDLVDRALTGTPSTALDLPPELRS